MLNLYGNCEVLSQHGPEPMKEEGHHMFVATGPSGDTEQIFLEQENAKKFQPYGSTEDVRRTEDPHPPLTLGWTMPLADDALFCPGITTLSSPNPREVLATAVDTKICIWDARNSRK